jgi:hypothetical protein
MGFAPCIGHDEAALRSGRQTFLEAVSIVWRNDERPAFICSRWGPKSEDGKNYGDAEKNNTKNWWRPSVTIARRAASASQSPTANV